MIAIDSMASHRVKLFGFTLVELMIALALGLTLSGAITKIYLQNNASSRQDEQVSRLQENARFALKLLSREIAMAGFSGGIPEQTTIPIGTLASGCATDAWSLNLTQPLDFIDNVDPSTALKTTGNETLTCNLSPNLKKDTDIISIKRTADRPAAENGVTLVADTSLDKQWFLQLSDNRSTKLWFNSTNASAFKAALGSHGSGIDMWPFYHKIFFIKNTNAIPSLCAKELNGSQFTDHCYVDGIENIQIEIGLDTDQDATPDIFKSSPTSAEMADAVVVRLYVLARSIEAIPHYTNSKNYYLGSTTIPSPNDGFFRRVYSTTIQIKNARLPNA